MSFNIQDFKSAVLGRGFQKSSSFAVMIAPPAMLTGSPIARDLMYYASSANIPGINILTQDVVIEPGHSLTVKRPYGVNVGDFTCRFVADGQSEVMSFFQEWMRGIVNFGAAGGSFQLLQTNQGAMPGEVQYPADYQTTISLLQYNAAGDTVVTYTFIDAFPASMSGVEMDWRDSNQIATFTVQFAYTTYTVENSSIPNFLSGRVGVFRSLFGSGGILGGLSSAYGIYNQVSSTVRQLSNVRNVQDAITATRSANQIFRGFGFGG